MSQKDFFDRSTAELESELQDAIEEADTTERDSRYQTDCVMHCQFYLLAVLKLEITKFTHV